MHRLEAELREKLEAAESKLKEAQEELLQTVLDIDLLNEIGDVLEPYDYKGSYADAVRKLLAKHDELARLREQNHVPADYVFSPEYDETPSGVVCTGGAYIPANKAEIEQGLSCKLYAQPKPSPEVAAHP